MSNEIPKIHHINLERLQAGIHSFWLKIVDGPTSTPLCIPTIIAKGSFQGKTMGITAAVHGNELNGIPVIQRLFKEIDFSQLHGAIIGVPVVNIPAFHRKKRRFIDNVDLNHIFPGVENGNVSESYVFQFFNKVIKDVDYLIDLHTASTGRINSYYIRADLSDSITKNLALLQNGQIVVHKTASDGTLRGAANEKNIPAITLEVGNPHTFQKGMIRSGLTGLYNALVYLKMITGEIDQPETPAVVCKKSYWIYTNTGGLLSVFPSITQCVKKGDLIAEQRDLFGTLVQKYFAPEDGIVIGKSVNPVNQTGGRIIHLGIIGSI